jgi:hypothetical protein
VDGGYGKCLLIKLLRFFNIYKKYHQTKNTGKVQGSAVVSIVEALRVTRILKFLLKGFANKETMSSSTSRRDFLSGLVFLAATCTVLKDQLLSRFHITLQPRTNCQGNSSHTTSVLCRFDFYKLLLGENFH